MAAFCWTVMQTRSRANVNMWWFVALFRRNISTSSLRFWKDMSPSDAASHSWRLKFIDSIIRASKVTRLHELHWTQWLQNNMSIRDAHKSTVWKLPAFYMKVAFTFLFSHVCCSKWNQCDAVQQVFYCTLVGSTCFGCRRHPSSGAQYLQSRSVGTMCCNSINLK